MIRMLKGIPVTLLVKTKTGVDPAGRPVYSWEPVAVENVLVAPLLQDSAYPGYTAEGHRSLYHMAIPKEDKNTWEGQLVQFWNTTWAVIGAPTMGIDELIPGPWNKKVVVERYRNGALSVESLWADVVTLLTVDTGEDSDGYQNDKQTWTRDVAAIFTEGVRGVEHTEDQKNAVRRYAAAEIWEGDYAGERSLRYNGRDYTIHESKPTGRGTMLLALEEVWR